MPGDFLVGSHRVAVDLLRRALGSRGFGGGLGLLGEAGGADAEQGEEEGGDLHGLEIQRAVPCVRAMVRIAASGFSYASRAAT